MADRPAIFASSALNLGIRQSEIRLIAITVISFTGGTILVFVLGWAVMQVVDRAREHRTTDTRRTRQIKSFEYKCKKDKKWNHFFNKRRWRNGERDGFEHPLVDIEAKRTRAALYPLRGGDQLRYLYPSSRLAGLDSTRSRFGGTDSEYSLPRMPLPTYSPAASFSGSSHSSPQFSPPSYRTDPSYDSAPEESPNPTQSNERYQYFNNGVALDIAAPIPRPLSYTTRIPAPRMEDEVDPDSFSLFSPPPLRIPSPPPPTYASPSSSSASPRDSPNSVYSSPPSFSMPFNNNGDLDIDIDYYMMFSDREVLLHSPDATKQEVRCNARRFGWANISACLPSNLSLSSLVRRRDAGKSMSGSTHGSPVLPGRPTGPLPAVPTTPSHFTTFVPGASSPSKLLPVSGLGLHSNHVSGLGLHSGSGNAPPAESLGCPDENKISICKTTSQPRSILLATGSTEAERPKVTFVSPIIPSSVSAPFPVDKHDQARHSLPSSASEYSTSAYSTESRVEDDEECDLSAIWDEMMKNIAPLSVRKQEGSSLSTDDARRVQEVAI